MGFLDKILGKSQPACDTCIAAPVAGTVIPLQQIPDEVFSQGILGIGCGIEPDAEEIIAPFDCEIIQISDTKHAIGLTNGPVELLIHVGIDTVAMNGEGFSVLVKQGQKVAQGTPLLRFDRERIAAHGHAQTVAVLCTNISEPERLKNLNLGTIRAGEPLMQV